MNYVTAASIGDAMRKEKLEFFNKDAFDVIQRVRRVRVES